MVGNRLKKQYITANSWEALQKSGKL